MKSDEVKAETNFKFRAATSIRQKLLEKYDHACASCGVKNDDILLETCHIIPISLGGETVEENLTLLCPNCNRSFDRQPREFEFVSFLAKLLESHPDYIDVKREALLGYKTRYRADIIVQRIGKDYTERLLIECKTYFPLTSRLQNIIAQLEKYRSVYGDCRMVLAVPATLRECDLLALNEAKIEVWDLHYIAQTFTEQIQQAQPGYYKALFLAKIVRPGKTSREKELIAALTACNPGKADWNIYQSLVGDILELLFTPPLGKPISELTDKAKANRRDFIMSNYTDAGFWAFMREKYEADYVIIDAKNYTRKVKKEEILQIANYLKPHGAGLFGLIISRVGGDAAGCEHTLREQWLVQRKLILVLDDDDVKEMLLAKSDGRAPEETLGQKIERFRLSM